jgi:hypothetical protein
MADREREADEFCAALAPDDLGEEEMRVLRQSRGPDLKQTDVPLSGGALAGRGPGSATSAAGTSIWPQFGLAPP